MMKLPLHVYRALKRLGNSGFRAYIVGGSVRDSLLGREASDYDITTDALPQQIMAIFSDTTVIPTGIKHGTVTVFIDDEPIEITTHRTEGKYSDQRHPDAVEFTDRLVDDLRRRDFTMNAIAYSPETGIIDPFDGRADIENKLIRAVGDPYERFSEDALRIVRALRFSAQLGFDVEENTAAAVNAGASLVKKVSGERIAAELSKAINSDFAAAAFLKYKNVIFEIFPMCAKMSEEEYSHNVKTASLLPQRLYMRYAALLHERSAASTPFATHNAVLALRSLKLDNATVNRTAALIGNYRYPFLADKKTIKLAFYRLSPKLALELIALRRADMLADGISESGCSYIDDTFKLAVELAGSNECFSLDRLNFSGNDAIALGAKGKQIGFALDVAMRAVISEKCENDRDSIIRYLKAMT